jgi:hypothetical protein
LIRVVEFSPRDETGLIAVKVMQVIVALDAT